MDIKQLQYFLEVSAQKNFTNAAQRLYITQPALSQQILKLENEIGFPLLQRSTREVALTEAGVVFLAYAQKVMKPWEEMQSAIQDISYKKAQNLSIGLFMQAEYSPFPAIIASYFAANPQNHVNISIGNENYLVSSLINETFDLIFLRCYATDIPPSITLFPLYDDPIYVLLNGQDSLAQQDVVQRADLVHRKLICEKEGFSNSYEPLQQSFTREGFKKIAPPAVCIDHGSILPYLLSNPDCYSFTTKQSGLLIHKRYPYICARPLDNASPVTAAILYLPQRLRKNIRDFCAYTKEHLSNRPDFAAI